MTIKWLRRSRIERQLNRAGSQKRESAELAAVAMRLHNAVPSLDPVRKQQIAKEIGFKPVHVARQRRLELAGVFAVFLVVILFAQSAQPGTPLYAIKRGSETVRLVVQPGFTDQDVADRREAELKELKRSKADKAAIEQAKDALDAAKDRAKVAEDQAKEAEDRAEDLEDAIEDEMDNSGKGSSGDNDGNSGRGRSGNN